MCWQAAQWSVQHWSIILARFAPFGCFASQAATQAATSWVAASPASASDVAARLARALEGGASAGEDGSAGSAVLAGRPSLGVSRGGSSLGVVQPSETSSAATQQPSFVCMTGPAMQRVCRGGKARIVDGRCAPSARLVTRGRGASRILATCAGTSRFCSRWRRPRLSVDAEAIRATAGRARRARRTAALRRARSVRTARLPGR